MVRIIKGWKKSSSREGSGVGVSLEEVEVGQEHDSRMSTTVKVCFGYGPEVEPFSISRERSWGLYGRYQLHGGIIILGKLQWLEGTVGGKRTQDQPHGTHFLLHLI